MLNGDDISYMAECMSFWKSLTDDERDYLVKQTMDLTYEKGSVIHNDRKNCTGVMLVVYGRLRVYIVGDDGKEITLYRLVERDVCVLSASCVLRNITFDVHIQAEEPTRILNIPVETYRHLEQSNQKVQDFTNQLVWSRCSDVMWGMEQRVFCRGQTAGDLLLEQSALVGSDSLKLTMSDRPRSLHAAKS
jgi:CRP/FNR family transcriptional regulator